MLIALYARYFYLTFVSKINDVDKGGISSKFRQKYRMAYNVKGLGKIYK